MPTNLWVSRHLGYFRCRRCARQSELVASHLEELLLVIAYLLVSYSVGLFDTEETPIHT